MKKRNITLIIGVIICLIVTLYSRWVQYLPDRIYLPLVIVGIILIIIGEIQIKNNK